MEKPMSSRALNVLKNVFGYDAFRGRQAEIIDQVSHLQEAGVIAAALNSALSVDERREIAGRLRRGEIRLLYLAPERLLQEHTLSFLQQLPISLFAIDEAHCVS